MKEFKYFGSVSHGTLKEEDLVEAFMDVLEDLDPEKHKEYESRMDDWKGCGDGYFLWEELIPALEEHAPPYFYFGAHEGDGSDFGYWFSKEEFDQGVQDGDVLVVDAGQEWPEGLIDNELDYVAEINDHGNITLFVATTRDEVWSIV